MKLRRKLVIALLLVLAFASRAAASISYVQEVGNTGSSSNPTQSITVAHAGDLLVLLAASSSVNGAGWMAPNWITGCGATWSKAAPDFTQFLATGSEENLSMWVGLGATASTCSVSMTWSVPSGTYPNLSWDIIEFQTVPTITTTATLQSATLNASGTATSWTTGTIITTNAADVLIGWVVSNLDTDTAGTLSDYGSTGGTPTAMAMWGDVQSAGAYQIVASTGTYGFCWGCTGTPSSTVYWGGVVLAIGVPPSPTPTPTITPTPTATATSTATITPTPSATLTITPTPSVTITPTPTRTITPTPSATPTPVGVDMSIEFLNQNQAPMKVGTESSTSSSCTFFESGVCKRAQIVAPDGYLIQSIP